MTAIEAQLKKFVPIALEEMDAVALLDRTDTKFVMSSRNLLPLLQALEEDYRVLEVGGKRQMRYRTDYFDTQDLDFFFNHHNGRRPRMKVRMREYIDSELRFLEVKEKPNTGRTEKQRIRVAEMNQVLSEEGAEYVQNVSGFSGELSLSMTNRFQRITLVHKRNQERFTIDMNISFELEGKVKDMAKIVIAEIKQARASRDTASFRIMRHFGMRPMGISKYCLGTLLLRPGIKYNKFKRTLLFLEKI